MTSELLFIVFLVKACVVVPISVGTSLAIRWYLLGDAASPRWPWRTVGEEDPS